ncbi:unnamed protein product, partial [Tetraodon nigroviridis]
CFCGATGIPFIPLSSENAACVLQVVNMTPEELFHLPLNIYIIILGVGLFILMLCLLFCCSMSRLFNWYRYQISRFLTVQPEQIPGLLTASRLQNQAETCPSPEDTTNPPFFVLPRHRRRRRGEKFGYNEVVLKGMGKKLSLLGQTCAVCLEEFCSRDELGVCPCSHAFHKKCLLKWLEIRSVCPMCNKPVC